MEKKLDALASMMSRLQKQREEDGESCSLLASSITSLTEALRRLEGQSDDMKAHRGQVLRCKGQLEGSSVTFNGSNHHERGHNEQPAVSLVVTI